MGAPPPIHTILLVDDDVMLRELHAEVLRQAGFAVTEAADGLQALGMLTGGAVYDLVLLDDDMPRLSGRGLYARLRQQGYPGPVVFCSGSAPRMAGGVVVLRKPVRPDDLVAAVRAALGE